MMSGQASPPLVHEVTLEVTLGQAAQLQFRLWLFTMLLRLAVWVGGFAGVEFIRPDE